MEVPHQEVTLCQEEILEILQKKLKGDKFTVKSFILKQVGEWVGLCGDHALLCVTLNDHEASPLTFFVKLYPQVQLVADFIEGTGCFRKEIFIYEIFAKMKEEEIKILNECVPECYLTAPSKYLVMENLTEQGYCFLNKHEYFDYDTMKIVLEALAKFHASSLIYEEKNSYRIIDMYPSEFEETYFNDRENFPNKEGLEAAFKGILNCIHLFDFPKKLLSGKDFEQTLKEIFEKVYNWAKPSQKFRNVINHGDLWTTNILIKHDENSKPKTCKLVDFQCGRYTPPAQDVLCFIHLTTSREFRQRYMYNLIGTYYTILEKHVTVAGYNMKNIIPFDEFLVSCDEQKGFALVQMACYFPLILLDSKVVREYFGNAETSGIALFEDRSLLVKEQMEQNSNYKKRIRDSLQDLKDYCDFL